MHRGVLLACCLLAPSAQAAELVPIEAPEPEIRRIALSQDQPGFIAAATRTSVHLSHDAGGHWHSSLQLSAGAEVQAIAVHPRDPGALLIGTSRGLMGSSDAGQHWKRLLKSSTGCQAVALHDPAAMLAACGTALFESQDAGRRWTEMPTPATEAIVDVLVDQAEPDHLYVLTPSALFWGDLPKNQWQQLYGQIRAGDEAVEQPNVEREIGETNGSLHHLSAVALDPGDHRSVYLSGTHGLLVSHDGGDTWEYVPDAGLPSAAVGRLFLRRSSPLTVFAATQQAVAVLSGTTDRWTLLPVPAAAIHDIAVGAATAWVATDQGLYQVRLPAGGFPDTPGPTAHALLGNFVHEPTMAQVREAAIRYADVHPEKIQRWRRQASLEALMPSLNFGYDRNATLDAHVDEGTFPNFQTFYTQDRNASLDTSISWDLGELIWNNDQTSIDVRSKLMVELRDDIVDEVTRAYFDRRRLQIETLTKPASDEPGQLDQELRLQELTARLDGLTGGYFSSHTGIHE